MKQNNLANELKGRNKQANVYSFMNVLCGTIPILLVVWLIDRMMKDTLDRATILVAGACMLVCALLKALFYGISIKKSHYSAYGVLADLRIRIVEHLKKLNLGFFQKRKIGDLTNIVGNDVEQVEVYLAHALPEIITYQIIPALVWIIVMVIDWRLGLALIAPLPVVALLRNVFNRLWKKQFAQYFASTQKMSEGLLEYVATIPVVKAFSTEETKTAWLLRVMKDYIKWVKNSMCSIALPMSSITLLLESGLIIMIGIGVHLLYEGDISITKFVLAIILGGLFNSSFAKMATFQHYNVVFNQVTGNINSILSVRPVEKEYTDRKPADCDINFSGVSFSYPDKAEAALSDINLLIKSGTSTAIVGESGCGKSTLANLVMDFWEPGKGTITIGGVPIRNMPENVISGLVSIVQQDVFLFNISIEENIRIGKPEATAGEIVEAARKARIHDFITALPQGYQTIAGEAGVKFSGGEKQRISIARMMLKNAPILLLDEATASLDSENEHYIKEAIADLRQEKTVITIAHHLDTITDMDQIVVMEKGKIVATGSYGELMESCEQFRVMITRQKDVDNWNIKE